MTHGTPLAKTERLFLIAEADMRLYHAARLGYAHNPVTGERVLKMDARAHRVAKVDMQTVNERNWAGDHPSWSQVPWVLSLESGRFG